MHQVNKINTLVGFKLGRRSGLDPEELLGIRQVSLLPPRHLYSGHDFGFAPRASWRRGPNFVQTAAPNGHNSDGGDADHHDYDSDAGLMV